MHKEIQSLEKSELFSVASTILCCAVFRSQGVGGNIGSFLHSDYRSPVERKSNEKESCSKKRSWYLRRRKRCCESGQSCFNMTRDGFVFLVMGYRGKKAASFKEAYIKRFNEMEEFIKYLLEARTEFPLLTDNIMLLHERPKPYYFSNEADMLNRIALGKTAKQVREEHGLKAGTSIRPYLTTKQIEAIDLLQRVDIGLLVSTPDFQERKRYLEWYYMKKLQ